MSCVHLNDQAEQVSRSWYFGCVGKLVTPGDCLQKYKYYMMQGSYIMNCPHCDKKYNTKVSLVQHQIRCKDNPDKIVCNSGFKGKTHTQEVRSYLSSLTTEQHKSGKLCPPPSFAGKKHTSETKTKISSGMVGNCNGVGRGIRTEYNGTIFRSTWEAKVARYLDTQGIEWKYEETCYRLEGNKSYRPDFFIYENGKFIKLIEVKGYFRKENKLKYDMFKQLYSDIHIELWDKTVLRGLKLI
jgi:hypothetical protein